MNTIIVKINYNMIDADLCMFTSNLGNSSILTLFVIMRYVFYLN